MSETERLGRARALLAAAGLDEDVAVSLAGRAHDIVAVNVPAASIDRVRAVAPALKQIGFRYVTVELRADG